VDALGQLATVDALGQFNTHYHLKVLNCDRIRITV
jgi:hypothetical protein